MMMDRTPGSHLKLGEATPVGFICGSSKTCEIKSAAIYLLPVARANQKE